MAVMLVHRFPDSSTCAFKCHIGIQSVVIGPITFYWAGLIEFTAADLSPQLWARLAAHTVDSLHVDCTGALEKAGKQTNV